MDRIRLRFKKTGRAVYLSHLDLMRTMQRAILRSGVPIRWSEGFNPHPLMSILLPLSVGAGSVCELMDARLSREENLALLPGAITAALPEGLEVTEAYESAAKVGELKWLRIEGVFEYDGLAPDAPFAEKLSGLYSDPALAVTKRTKRGEARIQLSDAVRELSLRAGGAGEVAVSAVVSAQEPSFNPELLAEAARANFPAFAPDFSRFTRVETYDADMNIFR